MPVTSQDLAEQEFMSLAPDIGVIPSEFRNRGYGKIGVKPGEGGLGALLEQRAQQNGTDQMHAFLAGVAAGADPQELATRLLGSDEPSKRGRASR